MRFGIVAKLLLNLTHPTGGHACLAPHDGIAAVFLQKLLVETQGFLEQVAANLLQVRHRGQVVLADLREHLVDSVEGLLEIHLGTLPLLFGKDSVSGLPLAGAYRHERLPGAHDRAQNQGRRNQARGQQCRPVPPGELAEAVPS